MQDERTLKMKQEYVTLYDQGLSPKEIAKKFNLSSAVIYENLAEIAQASNRDRASLLSRRSSPHSTHNHQFIPVPTVDVELYRAKFAKLKTEAKELSAMIGAYIDSQAKEETI